MTLTLSKEQLGALFSAEETWLETFEDDMGAWQTEEEGERERLIELHRGLRDVLQKLLIEDEQKGGQ
jgi:hypothetical protein